MLVAESWRVGHHEIRSFSRLFFPEANLDNYRDDCCQSTYPNDATCTYVSAEFTDRYVSRHRDWQRSYSGNCQRWRRCSCFYTPTSFFLSFLFFRKPKRRKGVDGVKQAAGNVVRIEDHHVLLMCTCTCSHILATLAFSSLAFPSPPEFTPLAMSHRGFASPFAFYHGSSTYKGKIDGRWYYGIVGKILPDQICLELYVFICHKYILQVLRSSGPNFLRQQ